MAEHAISEGVAMYFIKVRILEEEKEQTIALNPFEDAYSIPECVREYIMAARLRTAGFHVWASCNYTPLP